MSDSVRPHRRQPTRLPSPRDSPGKNTGVGCHFLLQCMKVKSESEVAQSCPTLSDPMDCSLPGSSVHGFSRQEYWSGVPLRSPRLRLNHGSISAIEHLLCAWYYSWYYPRIPANKQNPWPHGAFNEEAEINHINKSIYNMPAGDIWYGEKSNGVRRIKNAGVCRQQGLLFCRLDLSGKSILIRPHLSKNMKEVRMKP